MKRDLDRLDRYVCAVITGRIASYSASYYMRQEDIDEAVNLAVKVMDAAYKAAEDSNG